MEQTMIVKPATLRQPAFANAADYPCSLRSLVGGLPHPAGG
ncbi:MAG: hypothetical protein ACM3N4_01520 [Nitrososphaerota archaeon]